MRLTRGTAPSVVGSALNFPAPADVLHSVWLFIWLSSIK